MKFLTATSYKNLVFKCILSAFLLNLTFAPIAQFYTMLNLDSKSMFFVYLSLGIQFSIVCLSSVVGLYIRKSNAELLLDKGSKRKNYVRHILIFMVVAVCYMHTAFSLWGYLTLIDWFDYFMGVDIQKFKLLYICGYQLFTSFTLIPSIFLCLLTVFGYKPTRKNLKKSTSNLS